MDKQLLEQYILTNCIHKHSPSKPLIRKNGGTYAWMFDLRSLALDSDMLNAYANLFWDEMYKHMPFQLAAVELAGVPLMSALLHAAQDRGISTNGLIVRTKRKKYGLQKLVEGSPSLLPVVVIDDSCNSATAIGKAVVSLQNEGLLVTRVFTIVDFYSHQRVEWSFRNKICMHNLFSLDDFNIENQNEHFPVQDYSTVWTFASPKPNYEFAVAKSTPVVFNDTIIFGSDCGTLWCLDADTGRINWSVATNDKTGKGIVSSPALIDDKVYFGAYDGVLYCVDANTGNVIRSTKLCSWIGSSPLVINNKLYIGLEFSKAPQGLVACVNIDTFEISWSYPVREMLHGSATYSEKHNAIVIGTNDGTVLTLNADTGALINTITAGGPVKYHCALKDDLAVFGSFDGNIYVYNFITGEKLFSYLTDDIVYSRALIVENKAFMGSADGQFVVINLDKMTVEVSLDCDEKIHSSPTMIDGIVYFGTSSGELIGIDPVNYTTIVRLQFPDRLTNTLVKHKNMLYVYAYDNKMWAIKL
jgi:outer membrane protein assembly factor BamB